MTWARGRGSPRSVRRLGRGLGRGLGWGLGRGLGWAAVIAILLLLGSYAREAAAAKPYGVVTVDLRPEIGEVPTHLCVVSQGKGPRTREALRELLLVAGPDPDGAEAAANTPPRRILDLSAPAIFGGERRAAVTSTCEAGGACLPRIELPRSRDSNGDPTEQLWVACAADSLVSDQDDRAPRVLVMMLEHLEGSPPLLESLKLAGGIATIGVQADLSRIVVTARSLGGHYEAHSRGYRAEEGSDQGELVVLPIAPRCYGVEVELPGVRLRESDRERLRVRANEIELDPETCVGPLRGNPRMRVDLPRAAGFGRIEVELPPVAGETPTATRFAASWDTPWPATQLRLSPHQIAFVWAPPACVWATGTCPSATLEGGIACAATALDDGSCQYLCPGNGDLGEGLGEGQGAGGSEWVDVSPPVAVQFEKDDPDQRWTEIVQRPGQTLGAYVEPSQIYLDADLSGWRVDVPGSRISHVELLDNDGSSRRYAVEGVDRLQILAPHASCDPLRFRLVGDRRYLEGAAPVVAGQVEFGAVHETARLLTFNVLLAQGGGPAIAYGGAPAELANPIYFTAIGQLAANFRPRDPRFARVAYELRIGGTVGQWGYYGPGSLGEDPRRVTSKVAWARLLFEPAVVVDVVPPLALSFGFGVGGSWPINNREFANTSRFDFVLSPSLDARFAIRRWVALVVQGRAMVRERSIVATEVVGTVSRTQSFANVSLLGLYGVVFSF
jgi:hypothetical protein